MSTHFGPYELLERLGTGGMTEVFRARGASAQGVEEVLAVKLLLPRFARDARFSGYFLEEVRRAAELSHANIVRVFDAGRQDGHCFVAMEYVDGFDLAAILGHIQGAFSAMPPPLAVRVTLDACRALAAAHGEQAGDAMLHLGLHPGNILIDRAGAVRIVDFGIARALDRAGYRKLMPQGERSAYMAPELIEARAVDHRADLFSLGVILWELLTGRGLFCGESEQDIQQQVLDLSPQPPSTIAPAVPRGLDELVLRGLDRAPDRRFQSARELSDALARAVSERGLESVPADLAGWVRRVKITEHRPSAPELTRTLLGFKAPALHDTLKEPLPAGALSGNDGGGLLSTSAPAALFETLKEPLPAGALSGNDGGGLLSTSAPAALFETLKEPLSAEALSGNDGGGLLSTSAPAALFETLKEPLPPGVLLGAMPEREQGAGQDRTPLDAVEDKRTTGKGETVATAKLDGAHGLSGPDATDLDFAPSVSCDDSPEEIGDDFGDLSGPFTVPPAARREQAPRYTDLKVVPQVQRSGTQAGPGRVQTALGHLREDGGLDLPATGGAQWPEERPLSPTDAAEDEGPTDVDAAERAWLTGAGLAGEPTDVDAAKSARLAGAGLVGGPTDVDAAKSARLAEAGLVGGPTDVDAIPTARLAGRGLAGGRPTDVNAVETARLKAGRQGRRSRARPPEAVQQVVVEPMPLDTEVDQPSVAIFTTKELGLPESKAHRGRRRLVWGLAVAALALAATVAVIYAFLASAS